MSGVLKQAKLYLLIFVLVAVWSFIEPYDRLTWWLEASPALLAVAILIATFKKFEFTHLSYLWITIHLIILLIGAHYTYELVPLFDWFKESFDLERNHYDRLGHFAQGFIPALVMRELLLRQTAIKPGGWLVGIVVLSCLGISAMYEVLEWWAAASLGQGADAFLATQGDVWDTQKDMMLAGIGALSSLVILSRKHDRQLSAQKGS